MASTLWSVTAVVDRQSQSELAGMANSKRLVERVTSLQGLFDLIVEKDCTKQSEGGHTFTFEQNQLAGILPVGSIPDFLDF